MFLTLLSFRLAVERRTGLDGGNSRRRWHGTVRGCRLGDSQSSFTFCGDPLCSLCSILQVILISKSGTGNTDVILAVFV